ncbi:MAG: cohesin domain-containing protein [Myxococcota bacterium]
MKRGILAALTLALSLTGASAGAATLAFATPATDPAISDLFTVDIVAAGLGNGVAPSVGAYDFDIAFDAGLIQFIDAVPGGELGDPNGMPPTTFFSQNAAGGVLDIFEVSFLAPAALDAAQGDTVVLATLTFQAIAAGTTALSFDQALLSDALGNDLMPTVMGASLTIPAIPEPSAALIFGTALWIAARYGRRSR